MRESEILNSILCPLFIDAGYQLNEIKLDYTINSYVSSNNTGIRLSPDIVLLDNENEPLLIVETKSPIHSSLMEARYQALVYAEALNLPLYAITNGLCFILFSKSKREIFRTDSIIDEYQKLIRFIEKANLRRLSLELEKEESPGIEIELEKEWIEKINNELFIINENDNELKSIGDRVIGWLGDKIFEQFCKKYGLPITPAMKTHADFLVNQDKVLVKTIIEQEGGVKKRSSVQIPLNSLYDSVIVLIIIHAKLNENELLGYTFTKATIFGYIHSEKENNSSDIKLKRYKRSEFLPIQDWVTKINGGEQK